MPIYDYAHELCLVNYLNRAEATSTQVHAEGKGRVTPPSVPSDDESIAADKCP